MDATSQAPSAKPPGTVWIALALFAIALGVRLIGIGWGLPNELHNQSYHPDEQVIWAYSQQIEPTKLKFTPGFYNYGTLYLTALRIASDVVGGYGNFGEPSDPKTVWRFMGACHLAGRVLSAAAGAGSALFVFLALLRLTNPLGAAAGGLLLAVAPSFLVHSRFQTVDVLATFLLTVSLWQAIRILDDPNPARCALWAGAFAGLSAGTKYTGALMLFAIGVAWWLRSRKPVEGGGSWKPGWLWAFGAFLLAFFAATPGALLETAAFLRDFQFEMLHTSTGHGILFQGMGPGPIVELFNLAQGMGPLAFALSLAGLGWAAFRKVPAIWVVFAFAFPYFLLVARAEIHFVRYGFPLLVALAVGFGWLMGHAHERKGWHRATVVAGILGVGMALQIAMAFTGPMVDVDARDRAALWLKAEARDSDLSVGLVSDPWYYTPPLVPDSAIMRGQLQLQVEEMAAATAPRVLRYLPSNPEERYDWDIRLLDEAKPDFVVFSNFEVGPVARLLGTKNEPIQTVRFREFFEALENSYEQVAGPPAASGTPARTRFKSAFAFVEDMVYARPIVWIWKRRD